jgi:Heparinase II/III-like protein/Heparinase II/III N-terminus
MWSIAEVTFRARQETANLFLLASQPTFSGAIPNGLNLPDPRATAEALRGTEYAESIEATAEQIIAHRFPVLGTVIDTGPEICWRRDYMHDAESRLTYFRRIPYLDFASVGDHKFVWELNRHQHLPLLAQAFLFTGREEFKREIFSQIESWFAQNPFHRGINWASALEVAFRALSWIWVYHLAGSEMPDSFTRRFLTELYRHGRHLAENLSIYFSPNTHLLGEAVALHALGTLFPAFREARQWQRRGAEVIQAQLGFQVKPDGSHFEQSTYYHVYALDLFLFFYLLAGRPEKFEPVLARMGEYLEWLLGPAQRIAFFGDDDGGRFFHPYGECDQFGRATLTTCGLLLAREQWIGTVQEMAEQAAWWVGAETLREARQNRSIGSGNRLFKDSGMAFLQSGNLLVQIDCGPFGFGSAGHSHSDTLSLVASLGGERIFVDPGTYTYSSDTEERNWFRGSAAHNTVRIDGFDQADAAGPFRWISKPEVTINAWKPDRDGGFIEAVCRYKAFTHCRRILLEPARLLVLDEIEGPSGEHACEQIWQLGPAASKVGLAFSAPATSTDSKFSPAYGIKLPGTSLTVHVKGPLPVQIAMLLEPGKSNSITLDEARRMLGESTAGGSSPTAGRAAVGPRFYKDGSRSTDRMVEGLELHTDYRFEHPG